jgi:hypothetical protein
MQGGVQKRQIVATWWYARSHTPFHRTVLYGQCQYTFISALWFPSVPEGAEVGRHKRVVQGLLASGTRPGSPQVGTVLCAVCLVGAVG